MEPELHAVLKGPFEKLNELFFTSNRKENYHVLVSKTKTVILNERLRNFHATSDIGQVRSLDYKNNFKAREQRNFLLYFFPAALEGLLAKDYLDHYKLLAESVYILLKSKISKEELIICEN